MSVTFESLTGWFALLELPVLLAMSLLLIVYTIIHCLVVVPIAYFGYLVTSIPINAILNSSVDVQFLKGERTISVTALLQQNEVAIRNFAAGLPAFAISAVLKIAPLIVYPEPGRVAPAVRSIWAKRLLLYMPSGWVAGVVHALFYFNVATVLLLAFSVSVLLLSDDPDFFAGILALVIISLPILPLHRFARRLDKKAGHL
jgi:hypothetical protein